MRAGKVCLVNCVAFGISLLLFSQIVAAGFKVGGYTVGGGGGGGKITNPLPKPKPITVHNPLPSNPGKAVGDVWNKGQKTVGGAYGSTRNTVNQGMRDGQQLGNYAKDSVNQGMRNGQQLGTRVGDSFNQGMRNGQQLGTHVGDSVNQGFKNAGTTINQGTHQIAPVFKPGKLPGNTPLQNPFQNLGQISPNTNWASQPIQSLDSNNWNPQVFPNVSNPWDAAKSAAQEGFGNITSQPAQWAQEQLQPVGETIQDAASAMPTPRTLQDRVNSLNQQAQKNGVDFSNADPSKLIQRDTYTNAADRLGDHLKKTGIDTSRVDPSQLTKRDTYTNATNRLDDRLKKTGVDTSKVDPSGLTKRDTYTNAAERLGDRLKKSGVDTSKVDPSQLTKRDTYTNATNRLDDRLKKSGIDTSKGDPSALTNRDTYANAANRLDDRLKKSGIDTSKVDPSVLTKRDTYTNAASRLDERLKKSGVDASKVDPSKLADQKYWEERTELVNRKLDQSGLGDPVRSLTGKRVDEHLKNIQNSDRAIGDGLRRIGEAGRDGLGALGETMTAAGQGARDLRDAGRRGLSDGLESFGETVLGVTGPAMDMVAGLAETPFLPFQKRRDPRPMIIDNNSTGPANRGNEVATQPVEPYQPSQTVQQAQLEYDAAKEYYENVLNGFGNDEERLYAYGKLQRAQENLSVAVLQDGDAEFQKMDVQMQAIASEKEQIRRELRELQPQGGKSTGLGLNDFAGGSEVYQQYERVPTQEEAKLLRQQKLVARYQELERVESQLSSKADQLAQQQARAYEKLKQSEINATSSEVGLQAYRQAIAQGATKEEATAWSQENIRSTRTALEQQFAAQELKNTQIKTASMALKARPQSQSKQTGGFSLQGDVSEDVVVVREDPDRIDFEERGPSSGQQAITGVDGSVPTGPGFDQNGNFDEAAADRYYQDKLQQEQGGGRTGTAANTGTGGSGRGSSGNPFPDSGPSGGGSSPGPSPGGSSSSQRTISANQAQKIRQQTSAILNSPDRSLPQFNRQKAQSASYSARVSSMTAKSNIQPRKYVPRTNTAVAGGIGQGTIPLGGATNQSIGQSIQDLANQISSQNSTGVNSQGGVYQGTASQGVTNNPNTIFSTSTNGNIPSTQHTFETVDVQVIRPDNPNSTFVDDRIEMAEKNTREKLINELSKDLPHTKPAYQASKTVGSFMEKVQQNRLEEVHAADPQAKPVIDRSLPWYKNIGSGSGRNEAIEQAAKGMTAYQSTNGEWVFVDDPSYVPKGDFHTLYRPSRSAPGKVDQVDGKPLKDTIHAEKAAKEILDDGLKSGEKFLRKKFTDAITKNNPLTAPVFVAMGVVNDTLEEVQRSQLAEIHELDPKVEPIYDYSKPWYKEIGDGIGPTSSNAVLKAAEGYTTFQSTNGEWVQIKNPNYVPKGDFHVLYRPSKSEKGKVDEVKGQPLQENPIDDSAILERVARKQASDFVSKKVPPVGYALKGKEFVNNVLIEMQKEQLGQIRNSDPLATPVYDHEHALLRDGIGSTRTHAISWSADKGYTVFQSTNGAWVKVKSSDYQPRGDFHILYRPAPGQPGKVVEVRGKPLAKDSTDDEKIISKVLKDKYGI